MHSGVRDIEWKDSTIVEQLLHVRCTSDTDYMNARKQALELLELVLAFNNAKKKRQLVTADSGSKEQGTHFQFVAPAAHGRHSRKRALSRRPTPNLDSLLYKAKRARTNSTPPFSEPNPTQIHTPRKDANYKPKILKKQSSEPQLISLQQQKELPPLVDKRQKHSQQKAQQKDETGNNVDSTKPPKKRNKVKKSNSFSLDSSDTCRVIQKYKGQEEEGVESELFELGTPYDTDNLPVKGLLPSRLRVKQVCQIDHLVIGDQQH
eukprot:TRINITY_DN2315_c0_g1_i9.p1 TRINITY_DN2315_c0_g1~~TRINITY_DN2315_c0_g1_i9.p1  ORF type:complete len:263 (-),score=37.47 TRINITY_DN2315_c0_g1_i9:52-840(-)